MLPHLTIIENSAVGVSQTLIIALGAGLGIWDVINLMEGYGNDNSGQTIIAIENNKYNPSLDLAMRLARYLHTTVEELFELEEK